MAKNCAFTICTRSYIGLANILKESIFNYTNKIDFYIFVIDELKDEKLENVIEIKSLKLMDDKLWNNLSFKYDLTEFCTTLKPFIFNYIFETQDYEKVCYLDPDICFYNSINIIFDSLNNYLVSITPHFVTFPETEKSKLLEDEIRKAGVFNLGFIAIKKHDKTKMIVKWWRNNLIDKGFSNSDLHQFTDQKWIDLLPCYLNNDELNIVRNLGWNAAPWNFFERKFIKKNDYIYVIDRNNNKSQEIENLIFVHFSGYDYKKLLENQIIEKHTLHQNDFEDLDIIFNVYINRLKNESQTLNNYFKFKYTYSTFKNGIYITNFIRRLYNGYSKHCLLDDPFETNTDFYKKLNKNKFFKCQNNDGISYTNDVKLHKVEQVSFFFKLAFKILGPYRYESFLQFLKKLCRIENQVFLINHNYINWL